MVADGGDSNIFSDASSSIGANNTGRSSVSDEDSDANTMDLDSNIFVMLNKKETLE